MIHFHVILNEIHQRDDKLEKIDDYDYDLSNLPEYCKEMLDYEIFAEDTKILKLEPMILK